MATIERAIPVGGASLNFKVVGGTAEPVNPKENTIWVNTDAEVTGWAFAAENPYEGDVPSGAVWVKTGVFGVTSFNALKKNAVQIIPNACYQFDGTQFSAKPALLYQNGTWVNFSKIDLYNSGDTCSDVTGGWAFATQDTCAEKETYLQIGRDSQAYTKQPIDLTSIKSIHWKFNSLPLPDNTPCLAVATSGTTTNFTAFVGGTTYTQNTYNVEYTLDVSSLTGKYYVILRNQGWKEIQALQVWMEG